MHCTTRIKGFARTMGVLAISIHATLASASSLTKFDPGLRKEFIKPFEDMRDGQQLVSGKAKEVSLQFEKFKQTFNLPETSTAHAELKADRLRLDEKIEQLTELINVNFISISGFPKADYGLKYLVIGPKEIEGEHISIRSFENDLIDLLFRPYKPISTDLARFPYIVTYGEKLVSTDPKQPNMISAENADGGTFYIGVDMREYNDVAKDFGDRQIDIAGFFFFTRIVKNLNFDKKFADLDNRIDGFIQHLDKTENLAGLTFGQWRGNQPPPPQRSCDVCGAQLNADGTCPNAANHVKDPLPPPPPEQPLVKLAKDYWPLALIAVAVAAVVAFFVRKKDDKPQSQPTRYCPMHPGTALDASGKCPLCATEPPPPPPPPGTCKRCGAPLDEKGQCPECTRPPEGPSAFFNFDEDATRVPAAFDLEIVSPAKWAGRFLDRLPAKFEMGRYSEKNLPPPGMPFCALNLKGSPDAAQCSRRYIRLTQTADKSGFSVDLLADNECKVGGTALRKGENAVAKAGDEISILPDWRFKVVPRK